MIKGKEMKMKYYILCLIFFACSTKKGDLFEEHFTIPRHSATSPINYENPHKSLVGKNEKIAVIIEPRQHKGLPVVVRNVLRNLDASWSVQIFHGIGNLTWLKEELKEELKEGRIYLTKILVTNLTLLDYNHIMLSVDFWENVIGERVLLFETDSALCDHSAHKIEDFLSYDYIGAPWQPKYQPQFGCIIYRSNTDSSIHYVVDVADRIEKERFQKSSLEKVFSATLSSGVGNSGLSLRSRKKTLEVLKQYIPVSAMFKEKINDLFYSCVMNYPDSAMVAPTREKAASFSVESVQTDSPFGFHKSWIYESIDQKRLQATCPDYATVKKLYREDKSASFLPQ